MPAQAASSEAARKMMQLFKRPTAGRAVRYNQDYGAQWINATARCLNLRFYSRAGVLIDRVTPRQ